MGRLTEEWGDTRQSLVGRLGDWSDQEGWRLFFQAYSRMIYTVGLRSGLTDAEANDLLQETLVCLAKQMQGLVYNPAMGSFKAWLMQQTRWRIKDQFRKRLREARYQGHAEDGGPEPHDIRMEDIPDPREDLRMADLWDEEWKSSLRNLAVIRLKGRVSPVHVQIFQLVVERGWSIADVARVVGVSKAQVYLAKHRVARALKREVLLLRDKLI